MEDKLIELLETFGYPVILQGSLLPDEPYPDSFFTFWNNFSEGENYYDNDEKSAVYSYDVNFYSTNPELIYTKLREVKRLLKENRFIVSGDGHSVVSDEPTHDGRGIDVLYLKYYSQEE